MRPERACLIAMAGRTARVIPARNSIYCFLRLFLCLAIIGFPGLLRALEVNAQETASSLSGRIVDETGAVVPEVNVRIINRATGLQRRVTTDSDGYFVISLLPAGNYTLSAEMPSFATINIENLALDVSANSYIQITLRPKPISESINVHSAGDDAEPAGKIDISSATLKSAIGERQVGSLPILTSSLGRNTLGVLPYTVPGVSPTVPFGSGQSDTNLRGNQMSINGSRPSSVSFNLDGGDNNDYALNQASAPLPNPDALQQFTIVTNSYQADLGRSSGGVINALIKSGTNNLRGNARYFLKNEAMDARGFFDPHRPRDRLNTLGGQLGGPISLPRLFDGRNRAFFFADYEGTRSTSENLSDSTVLSQRERSGNFSDLPIADQPTDPFTGAPFPHGKIPAAEISPISRIYVDRFMPVPNQGERTFSSLLLNAVRSDQLATHFDFLPGQADAIGVAFLWIDLTTQNGTSVLPAGSSVNTQAENRNLVFRETHTFSMRIVNQLTAALTRFVDQQTSLSPGATGISPAGIGFTGVNPQTQKSLQPPGIAILSGAETDILNGPANLENAKTTWQIKDDLSYVRGGSALKFGGEVRGFLDNVSMANDDGNFQFGKARQLSRRNAIADFLIGYPSVYTQSSGSIRYPRQRAYDFYGMDDWRVRPNLTINVGLRYELAPPVKDKLDQVIAFRPGQQSRRFPNAPEGLLFAGDADPVLGAVSRGLYNADKTNFAPRVGMAYSPKPKSGWRRFLFGDNKTALRAGWGVFYDQTPGLASNQFAAAEPFSVSQRLPLFQIVPAGGTLANPFGSLTNPWPIDLRKPAFFSDAPLLHVIDPGLRTPFALQYNLTIQRELSPSLLLEIGYVGTNGFRFDRERELNSMVFGPDPVTGALSLHRAYPAFGDILSIESTGRTRFDSLQIRLRRRFKSGLTLDGSYVFGKSLDNGSDPFSTTSPPVDLSWARSDFDRRHNFVVSYSYDLPHLGIRDLAPNRIGGMADSFLNGWRISGITELRSGMPMPITLSTDPAVNSLGDRPDFVGPFVRFDPRSFQSLTTDGTKQTGHFLFDPNAFSDPGRNKQGTLGRNVFDGPGLNLSSVSLAKRFAIRDTHHIGVRADIRNLFNHANFQVPFLGLTDPQFGQVTSAAPGRNIQLSLRYDF
jgi:hypothetical protein